MVCWRFFGASLGTVVPSQSVLSSSRRLAQASSYGRLRVPSSRRGQAQCTGTYQASAGIICANDPLAKASSMTKLKFKGCRNKLHLLMGGATKYCGHFFPIYPDRCEFLVTVGQRSYLMLWVNRVILNWARKDWRSQWSNLNSEDSSNCGHSFSSAPNENWRWCRGKQCHSYSWEQAKVITKDIDIPRWKLKPKFLSLKAALSNLQQSTLLSSVTHLRLGHSCH